MINHIYNILFHFDDFSWLGGYIIIYEMNGRSLNDGASLFMCSKKNQ